MKFHSAMNEMELKLPVYMLNSLRKEVGGFPLKMLFIEDFLITGKAAHPELACKH